MVKSMKLTKTLALFVINYKAAFNLDPLTKFNNRD